LSPNRGVEFFKKTLDEMAAEIQKAEAEDQFPQIIGLLAR
jgi:hypothetical protein